jgi:hypothetical protein
MIWDVGDIEGCVDGDIIQESVVVEVEVRLEVVWGV